MTAAPINRFLSGGIAAIFLAATALLASPTAAVAAGAGVGDVSDAVLYGPSGPIGTVLPALTGGDDNVTTIPAPFPINFFGTAYNFLCVANNGTVTPVASAGDSCSGDYDINLENAATDQGASIIGALLADDDASETLWTKAVPIASMSSTGGVLTIVTSTPHDLLVGDAVGGFFSPDDIDLGSGFSETVASVVNPTTFTVNNGGSDFASRTVTGGFVGRPYSNAIDDTNSDGLADDGFGDVKQVYAGSTTFEGQPAFAITWYRMPTNDDDNLESKSNTFQLVFVQKPTTDGGTVGYDFDVQFNFGTLTDDNDGYDPTDPSSGCDSNTPVDCRWSVGWAQWDSVNSVATPFELFADAPVSEIVDPGGTTALVNNALNSTVAGRFTFSMVAGVTVGFAVPVLNGVVATDPTTTPAAPTLAETGVNATLPTAIAVAIIVLGLTLVLVFRRRRAARH